LFSLKELFLFKSIGLLAAWLETPEMRRARALREFSYLVPPQRVSLETQEYRFSYPVNGVERAFALRRRSSDVQVFLQVIRDGAYADIARLLPAEDASPRIIDAGANVGLATLYFKSFHPRARVIALEPEPGNFAMLRRCVEENGFRDAILFNEGLWTRDAYLSSHWSFRGGQSWSFALREAGNPEKNTIPVMSLASLLSRAGWDTVDLLKLDVEGTEAELFRDASFLRALRQSIKMVCLEVHKEVISTSEVQTALAGIGMDSIEGKEGLVAWRRHRH
jgi:FkbM family methyltransferase